MTEYTLTEQDVAGPFVEEIPPKMEEQADLKALSYTSPAEMLAERFHMSKDFLEALNPGKPLTKAGTVITVAAVPPMETGRIPGKELPETPKVTRIAVDKGALQVRAYGEDGALIHLYPASIGSEEKPAPSGVLKVEGSPSTRPIPTTRNTHSKASRRSASSPSSPARTTRSAWSGSTCRVTTATASTARPSPRRSARPNRMAASGSPTGTRGISRSTSSGARRWISGSRWALSI